MASLESRSAPTAAPTRPSSAPGSADEALLRAEEALREREAHLRLALQASGAYSFEWDIVSDRARRLGSADDGPPDAAATTGTLAAYVERVHPDDRARFRASLDAALAPGGDGHYRSEHRVVRADGSIRWRAEQGRVEFDAQGRPLRLLGVAHDVTQRRAAEEQLRTSEERFRRASAAAGALVYDVDLLDGRRAVAHGFEAVTGERHDGVIESERWHRRIHPEDLAGHLARFERALAGGATHWRDSYRVRHADGGWREVDDQAEIVRDAAGVAVRLVGTIVDVSARSAALREAQAAAARLRAAEAHQSFLLRLNDRLGRLTDAAQIQREAAAALGEFVDADRVGYAEDLGDGEHVAVLCNHARGVRDLVGTYRYADYGPVLLGELRAGHTVVRPDIARQSNLTDAEKAANAALQVAAAVSVPLLQHDRLVAILFVHSRAPRAWSDDEVALFEAVAERTASAVRRGLAEKALRESEERFRLMADQTPIVMWVTDPAGGIEFVNRAYCEFFGVTPQQVLGPNWQPLIHPDDGPYVDAFIDAVRRRVPFDAAVRVRRADDQWRWIESHGLPRFGPAGEYLGMIGVSPDVTEQRRATEQEREAARQKDQFIAVLAHELRNPLAPIRNAVALLKRRGPAEPELMKYRDIIDRQVAQMARLLDDLLDVARLSQGKLTLQHLPLRLAEVVEAAVETARPHVDERAHTLVVQPVDPALTLQGDKARLTQVLANVVNNAAKYTDRGGRIDIAVAASAGQAHLVVRDNGRGIDPAVGERIFELFAQADDAPQRGEGLGIGLALARRLVELHGGSIAVHSAGRGQGTTFTIALPLASAAASPQAVAGEAAIAGVRRRVLVVDDNTDAADTMAMLLESAGCEVHTVYDGEAALREANTFRPELVLLDLGMPGLSGQEACRRIRAEEWGAEMVIAAVTGWAQEGDRRRTQVAGFDHHLVKPVDPQALLRLVSELPMRL